MSIWTIRLAKNFKRPHRDLDYEDAAGSNLRAAVMLTVLGLAIGMAMCRDAYRAAVSLFKPRK